MHINYLIKSFLKFDTYPGDINTGNNLFRKLNFLPKFWSLRENSCENVAVGY